MPIGEKCVQRNEKKIDGRQSKLELVEEMLIALKNVGAIAISHLDNVISLIYVTIDRLQNRTMKRT